jgi:hypothetical protein
MITALVKTANIPNTDIVIVPMVQYWVAN